MKDNTVKITEIGGIYNSMSYINELAEMSLIYETYISKWRC